jgi:hypothetical protein
MHTTTIKRRTAVKVLATLLVTLLATLLGAASSPVLAKESQVQRVGRSITDGGRSSYLVRCIDGSNGSMYVTHETAKVCAVAYRGKLRCKKNWTLVRASEYACKVAPK